MDPWTSALAFLLVLSTNQDSVSSQIIHSVAGPFRVIPDHVEHCPPQLVKGEDLTEWHIRGSRDRHDTDLWFYTGNFTTRYSFDDSLGVLMTMASWSARGGWKDNAQTFKFKKMCSTIKLYLPAQWHHLMVAVHNNTDADCPFPPGVYHVNNVKVDLGIAKTVPAFFYGRWRLDIRVANHAWDAISCIRAFLQIVPRINYGSQAGSASTG